MKERTDMNFPSKDGLDRFAFEHLTSDLEGNLLAKSTSVKCLCTDHVVVFNMPQQIPPIDVWLAKNISIYPRFKQIVLMNSLITSNLLIEQ